MYLCEKFDFVVCFEFFPASLDKLNIWKTLDNTEQAANWNIRKIYLYTLVEFTEIVVHLWIKPSNVYY